MLHSTFFHQYSEQDEEEFRTREFVYHVFFIADMLLTFFTEALDQGSVERDLCKIMLMYFKRMFFVDLIAVLPLATVFRVSDEAARLLDLVKLVRLYIVF